MASITTVRDKNGRATKYRIRYRTPGGEQRMETVDSWEEARQRRSELERSIVLGDFIDPRASKMTFKTYADGWLDRKRQTVKPSTLSTFSAHLNKHLLPAFGARALGSISREDVKLFASGLQPAVKPTTARAIVFTLAAVLREAVDDGRLTRNPAERVKVGAKTERRVDPMHIATVAGKVPELAAAMPERWRPAVLLMAVTGLRLGECLGLTVDRCNFLRRSIRIDRQLIAIDGDQPVFGTPKTRAGVRTIPVSQAVVDMLAAHLVKFPASPDGLLFTTPSTRQTLAGRPVTRNRWADDYRVACAAAGVVDRTRTHDLRHVAASAMIADGLSVAAVQAALGHSSPAETLEVYTHLWPSDEERTRAAIERSSNLWIRPAQSHDVQSM